MLSVRSARSGIGFFTIAALMSALACADSASSAGGLQVRARHANVLYDGTTLFRGLFFAEGAIGQMFPELFDGTSPETSVSTDDERNSIAWIKTEVVNRINAIDAGFLNRFGSGVQSHNQVTVAAYMDTASSMVDQVFQVMFAESETAYEQAHATHCGTQIVCDDGTLNYDLPNHQYDSGALSAYDTVVVNTGDRNESSVVWRIKDVVVAYEYAGVLATAAAINTVAAINYAYAINQTRVVNKTKHWYKTRVDALNTSGGGTAQLSHDYVANLLASRLGA